MMYRVAEIYDTISGEAPTAGVPASFVRLHGCPVRCATCDTAYSVFSDTSQYRLGYLQGLSHAVGNVVGTEGGLASGELYLCVRDRLYGVVDAFAVVARAHFGSTFRPEVTKIALRAALPPEILQSLTRLPRTREGRRGYVAGIFDAMSPSVYRSSVKTAIVTVVAPRGLSTIVAAGLEEWGFVRDRAEPDFRLLGGEQRFFDLFQPKVAFKYGPYERRWEPQTLVAEEIVARCTLPLVVITGGEPLQQNLDALIAELHNHALRAQVETSGAYDFRGRLRPDILVVSPKPNMKYYVAPSVLEAATVFKLVHGPPGSGFDWNEDLAWELSRTGKAVFVMAFGAPPTQEAKEEAQRVAQRHGWKYSPRLHFDLGVR
jgi:organic radical activating enzyme